MKIRRFSILSVVLACLFLGGCAPKKHVSRVSRGNLQEKPPRITVGRMAKGHMYPKMADALEKEARKWLGVKYKYGGETKKGIDCSGLVMNVFRDAAGVKLPRSSAQQQQFCTYVSKKSLVPGDLVFFSSSLHGKVTHVGIYIGSGRFIHASGSRGVIISDLSEKYYESHYHSGGRVPLGAYIPVQIEEINLPATKEHDDIYVRRPSELKSKSSDRAREQQIRSEVRNAF